MEQNKAVSLLQYCFKAKKTQLNQPLTLLIFDLLMTALVAHSLIEMQEIDDSFGKTASAF